jgi:hypothetical protein
MNNLDVADIWWLVALWLGTSLLGVTGFAMVAIPVLLWKLR